MSYLKPENVDSPKTRWKLDRVIYDGGEENWSLAEGFWDKQKVLAIRWNGTQARPKSMPISNGQAVWLIVPDELVCAVMGGTLYAKHRQQHPASP